MQFYHKCEKTVTGTLCSGIVVHYGQNTHYYVAAVFFFIFATFIEFNLNHKPYTS